MMTFFIAKLASIRNRLTEVGLICYEPVRLISWYVVDYHCFIIIKCGEQLMSNLGQDGPYGSILPRAWVHLAPCMGQDGPSGKLI